VNRGRGHGRWLADKAGDEPTAGLLPQRLTVHEQTAWMLRSLLEA
jgi:starvation-inducible DNA-binding protein